MNDPGERAQQIWASSLYLKTNYGLNISYGVIYNEPGFTYTILADDIKALGPRMSRKDSPPACNMPKRSRHKPIGVISRP